MAQPKVFVSHSHVDDVFASNLVGDILAAGANAWLDKTDLGAGNFQERINQALGDCEWFVLVLSRNALASPWVRQEVDAANRLKHQGRIRDLIFVQAGPVEHSELPPLWGVYNVIDATVDYAAALNRVLNAVGVTAKAAPALATSQAGVHSRPNTMIVQFEDGTSEEYDSRVKRSDALTDHFHSVDGAHLFAAQRGNGGVSPEATVRRLAPVRAAVRGDPYWQDIFAATPDTWAVAPRDGLRMRLIKGPGWFRMEEHLFDYRTYFEHLKPEERISFPNRLRVAIKIAEGLDFLETCGITHPNVSPRSIMVNRAGKASLTSLHDTFADGEEPTILGNLGYLAPELLAPNPRPDSLSTRHALAVLLYQWFIGRNPFDGDRAPLSTDLDEDWTLQLGDRALYIEHPSDHTNIWKGQRIKSRALGFDLERIFQRTFVEALHLPARRPSPREFVMALQHAADLVVPCATPDCDWHGVVADPATPLVCVWCGTAFRQTPALPYLSLIGPKGYVTGAVAGWENKRLLGWHVRSGITPLHSSPADAANALPQAMVEYSGQHSQWLLRNLALPEMAYWSSRSWQAWPVGDIKPLTDDMRIKFGPQPEYNQAICKLIVVNS